MPPLVALLLCATVVLGLLWIETRGTHHVSRAQWIPTLWMLVTASKPLAYWFGVKGSNESGSLLDRLFLSGLALCGMWVLARRRFDWISALRDRLQLLVLVSYMCISTLWSDIPTVALKRWGREVVVLIVTMVITSEPSPSQALTALLRRTAYVLLPFSLVLIKYYPDVGRDYGRWSGIEMWTGVTGQKNELGRLCMVSIFFISWVLYHRGRGRLEPAGRYLLWADGFIVVLAGYLLWGSNSVTSLATLIVGVAMYAAMQWLRSVKLRAPGKALSAAVLVLIAYGTSVPFLGGSDVAQFTSLLGRDTTLTGRTEVWADVLPAREQRPILGYGFGSFWTDARRELYDIPTAHNGYLDILLELGEVGLMLYCAWLLSCAKQLHRVLSSDYEWASVAICLLLMSLLYNVTESALNSLTDYITAMVVCVSFALPGHSRSRVASDAIRAGRDSNHINWQTARNL